MMHGKKRLLYTLFAAAAVSLSACTLSAAEPDQEELNLIQAAQEMRRVDRDRKAYHNYYCDTKWGDARGYDLVVNSGKLGIEKTVDTLVAYVRAYQAKNETE